MAAVMNMPAFPSRNFWDISLINTIWDHFIGQAFSQPLNSRSRIMFTKEGPAKEDDSYMGYSVATGDFIGNGDSGTAVGVPRGSDLLGKVCNKI